MLVLLVYNMYLIQYTERNIMLSSCCRLFRHCTSILLIQSTLSERPAHSNSDFELSCLCTLTDLEQARAPTLSAQWHRSSHFECPGTLSLSLLLSLSLSLSLTLSLSLSLSLSFLGVVLAALGCAPGCS